MPSSFPTLSKNCNVSNYTEEKAVDPTIRSEFNDGRQLSRSKFTNVCKKWTVQYNFLTHTDKETLSDFENDDVSYGASSFYWQSPSDNITYEVRFQKTLSFVSEQIEGFWAVQIIVAEIRPNSHIAYS